MANFLGTSQVRLAVLEEKLTVYEELSKEMLSKLEAAVDKISEANQNVAKILVRHEERLDQSIQADTAIVKLLEEFKKSHERSVKETDQRITALDNRIDDLAKFKWIIAGALLIVGVLVGQVNLLESVFPQVPSVHSGK
jgi:chromosome segregation ATPase